MCVSLFARSVRKQPSSKAWRPKLMRAALPPCPRAT